MEAGFAGRPSAFEIRAGRSAK
jgi:transposase